MINRIRSIYNIMNISAMNPRTVLLQSNNTGDMLSALFAARGGMHPCADRAGADRVDHPAGGRKPPRAVSSGASKQGDAGQAAASLLPNRDLRAADIDQAHAALYQ